MNYPYGRGMFFFLRFNHGLMGSVGLLFLWASAAHGQTISGHSRSTPQMTLALSLAKRDVVSSRGRPVMRGAEACAALFGDEKAHQLNQQLRARSLDWIEEEREGVTVAHTAESWEEPTSLELRGLTLLNVWPRGALGQCVVSLSADLAKRSHCPTGSYLLTVDDALSQNTRILAVLENGLLVHHRQELRFISLPRAPSPRWLLAWRMRAEIPAGSLGQTNDLQRPYYLEE